MKSVFSFLYVCGAALIAVFFVWRFAPTDLMAVTFAAEIFAVLSAALGVTCIFVARRLQLEWKEMARREYRRARAEAEEAVSLQVESLERELAAAREYIERMDRDEK